VGKWKPKRHEGSSQRRATPREHEVSILEALKDFVRYLKDERQASPYTLDAYERDLLCFATAREAADKELALTSVTPEEVRTYMHAMIDRHLAKATVRRAMYALGSFFGWAVRWGLVPMNPVAQVNVPRRERSREVRALSGRERAIFIAAADQLAKNSGGLLNQQAPTLVRLMLKTGLRRSEVIDLTWRDVDFDRREILIRHGKGDKSRRVPIEDRDLLARLRSMYADRGIGSSVHEAAAIVPVFVGTTGRQIAWSSFYRLFRRVLAKAELAGRGITPHTMRHTFGSMLCAKGVSVPYVKDLLGHEDIGSTMVYVHSTPTALREAVKRLGD
jgi:integrase/recombinase XerC